MRPVTIQAGQRSYPAYIGANLLDEIGSLVKETLPPRRCAIVTDENVAPFFAEIVERSLTSAGFEPILITVPAGEHSKSLEQAGAICDRLTAARFDRSSFILALGGGVIGDLAGFVAAIYHRGIPWVQAPTTLLAQVDSAIGGKTAVNTAAGKNLIGAVHQPLLVVSDVEVLKTLPRRERNQGFAEIIKHAIIRDASLFQMLESGWEDDPAKLVRRNVEIKAEFVAGDERDETGLRALLNFGHTVGHAIEQAGEYRELLHGEAVSLGMVAACEVSVRKAGFPEAERAKVVGILEKFGLPTRLPASISREKIVRALPLDKKFERGEVRFVVTPRLGSARVATDVTIEDIRDAVTAL